MFVGHLGAGLAAKAVARDINLGAAMAAALLLDAVLWLFVLAGWEKMIVPADYAQKHFLLFDFPLSHSLVAALLWAALAPCCGRRHRGARCCRWPPVRSRWRYCPTGCSIFWCMHPT